MPRGQHWRTALVSALFLCLLGCATAAGPEGQLSAGADPFAAPEQPLGTATPLSPFELPTPYTPPPTDLPTATTTPTSTATPLPTSTPFISLDDQRRTPQPSASVLGRGIVLQQGFKIGLFAREVQTASSLAYSPDGVLFASLPGQGQVVALPDGDQNGEADQAVVYAAGLVQPRGIAFQGGYLYVAEEQQVVRYRYEPGALTAREAPEVVVAGLPVGSGFVTHEIGFGPDGKLYVAIGASCNACEEADSRRATIMRFEADGSGGEIYARGLRNVQGLTWYPGTEQLLATNCSRSRIGDDAPVDTIEAVFQGAHFGWPYCHGGEIVDPDLGEPDACQGVPKPFVSLPAQTTPGGILVYTGGQFPQEYYGDIFVASMGSWERRYPVGYTIVRIHLADGQVNKVEDFASGWLVYQQAWGQPTALVQAPDGSLLISDSRANAVYRIYYGG